jgi:hypothetical protein
MGEVWDWSRVDCSEAPAEDIFHRRYSPTEVLKNLIPFSNSTAAPMIKARDLGHARNFLTEVWDNQQRARHNRPIFPTCGEDSPRWADFPTSWLSVFPELGVRTNHILREYTGIPSCLVWKLKEGTQRVAKNGKWWIFMLGVTDCSVYYAGKFDEVENANNCTYL